MAQQQISVRKKHRKKQRKRYESEESSSAAAHPGLGLLQQSIGNRAVQRMLAEDSQKTEHIAAKLAQRQLEKEDTADSEEETPDGETEKELSNVDLLEKFKPSEELTDLDSGFRRNVEAFINLLEQGGATVEILATAWSPELAYLLHWAWRIVKEGLHPMAVPPIDEVDFNTDDVKPDTDIIWWHGSLEASQAAAEEIVKEAGIADLEEPPVLTSHHVTGEAIDMKISWNGELLFQDPLGGEIIIASSPQDETNPDLIDLAATYGIIHYEDVDRDPVHWSIDGT